MVEYNSLDQQGIWECWLMEDDSVVVVDQMQLLHDFPFYEARGYKGKKIKNSLGFATTLWDAYCMYSRYTKCYIPIPRNCNNQDDIDSIIYKMKVLCDTTH